MGRKIILNLIILALLSIVALLIAIAPYHIYTLSLTDGVETRFLSFKSPSKEMLNGHDYVLKRQDLLEYEDSSVWKEFHFENFLLFLPIHHPNYVLLPLIFQDNDGVKIGADFINMRDVKIASFKTLPMRKFELVTGRENLFLLPIYKKMLDKISAEKKWEDLFSKKLSLPSNEGKSFFESLKTMWQISYDDLVYNLYLMYNRQLFFKEKAIQISFDKKLNIGVAKMENNDPRLIQERFYFFENGIVYTFELNTIKDSPQSKNFRFKILNSLKVKFSTPDSAVSIYAEYQNLTYRQRIDAEGMTYLIAAWSHDIQNKEFLRVMISFLERGDQNIKFLKPLYEFAFKKYGTNLSSKDELIIETANERAKRKVKEELEKEIINAEMLNAPKQEGTFSNEDEKIKYFLQKAKDAKFNSDTKRKELRIP